MLSPNDFREVVQNVSQTVLEKVTEQLKQMYPTIVDGITQQVRQEFRAEIDGLKQQIASLQSGRPSAAGTSSKTQFVPPAAPSSTDCIDMRPVLDYQCVHGSFLGVIYYFNPSDHNYLYAVKEDGSCNTQLTDFACSKFYNHPYGNVVMLRYENFEIIGNVPKSIKVYDEYARVHTVLIPKYLYK